MEVWFGAAIIGAALAGISNFYFKIAAERGYNAELFTLYGSFTSVSFATGSLLYFSDSIFGHGWEVWVVFVFGTLSALAGTLKIYALRHIDSTIYFPLFKLLAPLIAIVYGITIFGENFSYGEWSGMLLGLFVPLMLITRKENNRQNNLIMGLLLVLITGVISASSAAVNKFAIDQGVTVSEVLFYAVIGLSVGALLSLIYKGGPKHIIRSVRRDTTSGLLYTSFMRASLIVSGSWMTFYAYSTDGTLAVVQTIHSMYILIPIVLAIIIYKEHWNWQKVIAIVLSVASLALLG